MIKMGNSEGSNNQEILLDEDDKIVSVKLWPNRNRNRFGGFEFVVAKRRGRIATFSVKCQQLGEPVSLDVKSGRICGITGRSGDEIDGLGFYFI